MPLHWLQTVAANAPERKIALIVAGVATFALAGSLIWSLFSSSPNSVTAPNIPTAVQVIEKPKTIATQQRIEVKEPAQIVSEKPKQAKPIITQTKQQEVKPTLTKKKVVVGKGNLYVQVGAFKQPNLARLLYEKMTKKYKRAKIILRSNMYVVWVGPVVTYKEAATLKQNIQRRENIKGFIVSDK